MGLFIQYNTDCCWLSIILIRLWLFIIVFNSDFVMIAEDCLWFWFGCDYWCFFHDFDSDMTVHDRLWFCFAVDLFFHDPAWDMIVDYCFCFSCGFIYWSCPATPTKGGRRHQGASPFYKNLKAKCHWRLWITQWKLVTTNWYIFRRRCGWDT